MNEKLRKLNAINDVPIYSVQDEKFKTYGRVIDGYDMSKLCQYLEEKTAIPESGNCYVASEEAMEEIPVVQTIKEKLYGGMEIQVGYCNGQNTTYNGFEYHKGSEINIAATDFMLVLGHTWEISDNTYRVEDAVVFFVEKGTAIEMYQTTLHLSPCKVEKEGFRDVVILPRGTNTPLEQNTTTNVDDKKSRVTGDQEEALLLMKNKWVLAHKDREPLIRQGAYPGLLGENKELYYE